ncbi:twin-arginine translocation signal domain-containing protein [Escherichia coli]
MKLSRRSFMKANAVAAAAAAAGLSEVHMRTQANIFRQHLPERA